MTETSLLTPDDEIIKKRIEDRANDSKWHRSRNLGTSLFNELKSFRQFIKYFESLILVCPECKRPCKKRIGLIIHLQQTHKFNYLKINEAFIKIGQDIP